MPAPTSATSSAKPEGAASAMARLPTLFIPHGGGPCFFMEPPPGVPADTWKAMEAYLRGVGSAVGRRPQALLVVSAHWETERPTVLSASRHTLLFDYYGFPPHTYRLQYPASGAPAVAARVRELLDQAGIANAEESARGLDHGVFIPLLLMYPQADIPVVQLSLGADLDPARHLALGRALAPLRDEGVLIVGSGLSYHNLRQFMYDDAVAAAAARSFDDWLTAAATEPDAAARASRLAAWSAAPGARSCHPRAEHLLPLMVAAGAGGDDIGRRTYNDQVFGKAVSAFQFG
jgi:aromatic ring-opening dioxygenase catalytic subunit (LigB family)